MTFITKDLNRIAFGRILGIDYGRKRIGLALSDPTQLLAVTLDTIENKRQTFVVDQIKSTLKEYKVVAIVFGKPLHMSGDESALLEDIGKLTKALSETGLPIYLWDERWTTVSAENLLKETGRSPSKNRNKIDQIAAAFMLQNFLDRLANTRSKNIHLQT